MTAYFTMIQPGTPMIVHCGAAITFGRDKNSDVVLDDPQASRNHAVVRRLGADDYYVIDSGSANGSFINGRRVAAPAMLNDSDRVQFGSSELLFSQQRQVIAPREAKQATTLQNPTPNIRQITILVSDLRDFTRLSEELPITTLSKIMSQWFSQVSECIAQSNGTVEKFIGDCVYARWETGNVAQNSVCVALKTAQQINAITQAINRDHTHLPRRLQIGVGINFGEAAVGLGRQNAAIGDAVNLTFRLESSSKELRTDIVVGENAFQHLPRAWWQGKTQRVLVKGKKDPVEVCGFTFEELARLI